MIALEIADLRVVYGRIEALHGVSVRVGEGQIVSVIGPNGAGKTTLLLGAMGLLPSRGRVAARGVALDALAVEERVAAGVCLVPERRELFAELSVLDNLRLGAYSRRRGVRMVEELEEVFACFPRLKERAAQPAGTLSGGERQMLALGRALMAKPRVLLLDEPSLGLAPLVVAEIFAIVRRLRRDGVSILLVEQNARAALAVSDYAYVLENGALALEGRAETLLADERVKETYLGLVRGEA